MPQCLAPLTLPWLEDPDPPCGECVRSDCSDCCAMAAGVGTEGLEEPSCLTPVVIIGHSISAQMLTGGQSILNSMLPRLKMLF